MTKLKSFNEFLNEGEEEIKKSVAKTLSGLLSGDTEFLTQFAKNLGLTTAQGEATPGTTTNTGAGGSKIPTTSSAQNTPETTVGKDETSLSNALTTTSGVQSQGNDDFVLYMQHQQGVAGATGLVRASMGIGKLASDTIKTKAGVKYANLIMNVPSDRPNVKQAIIRALDSGDQKSAALAFMAMWKEKWASKYKQAQSLINNPNNSEVKKAITKYCAKYVVPFDFAVTVATIESGLNPKSGNKRYKGLFALSQEEFNKYTPGGNIFNIDNNTSAGIQCLKRNIKEFIKYMGPTAANINVSQWAKYA